MEIFPAALTFLYKLRYIKSTEISEINIYCKYLKLGLLLYFTVVHESRFMPVVFESRCQSQLYIIFLNVIKLHTLFCNVILFTFPFLGVLLSIYYDATWNNHLQNTRRFLCLCKKSKNMKTCKKNPVKSVSWKYE